MNWKSRMKQICLLLLTVCGMLLVSSLSASAAAMTLYDEKGILSEEEREECIALLQEAADATGMNVGVIIGGTKRSDSSIETLADTYYDEVFGKRTDGLLYYMDLNGYEPYDYISTSGLGQFYYTDGSMANRVDAIFKHLDSYLYPVGMEDAAGAIAAFADEVVYYYEAGIPDGYYLYDDVDRSYYVVENGEIVPKSHKPLNPAAAFAGGFFGLIGGCVIGLIVFFAVKHTYRFKSSPTPTTYVNKRDVQYHHQYDNFIRTYTRKEHIETNSGSSGGGGGGGGHSSGGHGGGGYHR